MFKNFFFYCAKTKMYFWYVFVTEIFTLHMFMVSFRSCLSFPFVLVRPYIPVICLYEFLTKQTAIEGRYFVVDA